MDKNSLLKTIVAIPYTLSILGLFHSLTAFILIMILALLFEGLIIKHTTIHFE